MDQHAKFNNQSTYSLHQRTIFKPLGSEPHMSSPFISIIIPAYNEENYIRQTLHSLQLQTYQHFETIIVANGCTDQTEEIVRKRENEKLKLISLPTAHVSIARNQGAAHAVGEILLFLDADTTLEQDALKKIITTITTKTNNHQNKHTYGTTKTAGDNSELKFKALLTFKNIYLTTGLHQGSSGAFYCTKEIFNQVGKYNEKLTTAEHHELIGRLKPHASYLFTPTTATTSLRRYREWGVKKIAIFWLKRYMKRNKEHSYEHIK